MQNARMFIVLALGLSASLATADTLPLWGVDEDSAELFVMTDYRSQSGITNFGSLTWQGRSIRNDIESFAFDPYEFGQAYMVVNRDLNDDGFGHDLVRYQVAQAGTDMNVSFVASLDGMAGFDPGDVNGLDFDDLTGDLYFAGEVGNRHTADMLYRARLDRSAGSIAGLDVVGRLSDGAGLVGKHEDIVFANGRLYVSDDQDDDILIAELPDEAGWGLDADLVTGMIEVKITDQRGHAYGQTKFEALAFDPSEGGTLVAANVPNSNTGSLYEITGDGPMAFAGGTEIFPDAGLRDVEGMDFLSTGGVPEPASVMVLAAGSLLLLRRTRKE